MGFGWQEAVVGAVVIAAVAWLVADARRRRRKRIACDTCELAKAARERR